MSRVSKHLNRRATQVRTTEGALDDMGGAAISTETLTKILPCRVMPAAARERESAGMKEARHDHTLYFEPSADVRRGDVLTVAGLELTVELTVNPSKDYTYLKALCSRGEHGQP